MACCPWIYMGCGQKTFMPVLLCHELRSGFLANDHLPRLSWMSVNKVNNKKQEVVHNWINLCWGKPWKTSFRTLVKTLLSVTASNKVPIPKYYVSCRIGNISENLIHCSILIFFISWNTWLYLIPCELFIWVTDTNWVCLTAWSIFIYGFGAITISGTLRWIYFWDSYKNWICRTHCIIFIYGCATSHRLKWGSLLPNEGGSKPDHVMEKEVMIDIRKGSVRSIILCVLYHKKCFWLM